MALYRYQQSFAADPTLSPRVFALLDLVFPGVLARARYAAGIGTAWERASTPFVLCDGDAVLSHVGVLELPMVLGGRRATVGVVHAVATHPQHRRRGYYRQVMTEALHYCDARYETVELCTARPELYAPFGFRVVPEHRFLASISPQPSATTVRRLSEDRPADVALLRRLLATRAAVSQVLGVVEDAAVFPVQESLGDLLYAADLDAIIACEISGATLQLRDVVATQIPPLCAIVDCLPQPIERAEIYVTPDCLEVETQAEPHVLHDGDDDIGGAGASIFMVRGPFAPEGRPFMLPRSARC